MKKLVSLLVALCLLALCACSNKDGGDDIPASGGDQTPDGGTSQGGSITPPDGGSTPVTPNTPDTPDLPDKAAPLEWSDRVFSGTFTDETLTKDPLVMLTVYLPTVKGNDDIELYYQGQLDRMKELAQTTYLDLARGNYQFASQGIGIFSPVTVELGYKVLYNDGRYFSVRRDIYENTGGAHPSLVLKSETFRLSDGALMVFSDMFKVSYDEAIAELRPIIEQQMDEKTKEHGSEYYYAKAKEELFAMWDKTDWYLTEDHLVMYWQTYAISPYVAGIQEFFIPIESIADIFNV